MLVSLAFHDHDATCDIEITNVRSRESENGPI